MNKDNIDGGPAFPTDGESQIGNALWHHSGMTLRDYFAAKAMQAAATSPDGTDGFTFEQRANWAYQQADAMIKARLA